MKNRLLPLNIILSENQIDNITEKNINPIEFVNWRMFINIQNKRINQKLCSKEWSTKWKTLK